MGALIHDQFMLLYVSSFSSSNLFERKSATTRGGVLAGRTIAGAVGNKWGFPVSSRARTVWAAKPRVPKPDNGKPICSTAERVRGSFLFLLSVHTERRKYMNIISVWKQALIFYAICTTETNDCSACLKNHHPSLIRRSTRQKMMPSANFVAQYGNCPNISFPKSRNYSSGSNKTS